MEPDLTLIEHTTRLLLAGRVGTGIVLLDQELPDWWRADRGYPIDLDRLAMNHADACVLGQLTGGAPDGYFAMRDQLGLAPWQVVSHGFQAQGGTACTTHDERCACGQGEYDLLAGLWRKAVISRRATALQLT